LVDAALIDADLLDAGLIDAVLGGADLIGMIDFVVFSFCAGLYCIEIYIHAPTNKQIIVIIITSRHVATGLECVMVYQKKDKDLISIF
jgi:hypothetical protein